MITVDINNATVDAALQQLHAQLADMTPVMQGIAEMLVASTKRRFASGESPEGVKWAAKSPVTLAKYGARKSNRVDARPLFGPSGMLNSQIFPDSGPDFAEVGSSRVYAAMMQFGGTKASYPHLWGDIPARPFLGLSAEDEANILEEIASYLGAANP